jgi:hypothetical protein
MNGWTAELPGAAAITVVEVFGATTGSAAKPLFDVRPMKLSWLLSAWASVEGITPGSMLVVTAVTSAFLTGLPSCEIT